MACGDGRQQQPLSQRMKELLGHGAVSVQSMFKEYNDTYNMFSWRIFGYSELRLHVLYYQLFENSDMNCVFKIFKTRRALYVCLRSAKIKNKTAQFYIDDEADHVSLITYAREIKYGLYVGDFMNDQFLSSDSTYLKNGILTVSFRYMDTKQPVLEQSTLQKPDPIADPQEFSNDLKHMYLAALCSDFMIRVGDYTFDAHRFILASRSKFFEDSFTQYPTMLEYEVVASPRIVHQMLVYLYSGELKQVEMSSMLEMYDLARELGIDTLSDKCLCLISEHISQDNYGVISALAEKMNSVELRNIINSYRGGPR